MLQFMGSQRVRHDWATELDWNEEIQSIQFTILTFLSTKHSWLHARQCFHLAGLRLYIHWTTFFSPPTSLAPGEVGMATHSSTLAWRIPCPEEPGRLCSMELQRVRQDWSSWTHPALGNHPSTFCFYETDSSKYVIEVESDSTIFVFLWLNLFYLAFFSRIIQMETYCGISLLVEAEWYCIVLHLINFSLHLVIYSLLVCKLCESRDIVSFIHCYIIYT